MFESTHGFFQRGTNTFTTLRSHSGSKLNQVAQFWVTRCCALNGRPPWLNTLQEPHSGGESDRGLEFLSLCTGPCHQGRGGGEEERLYAGSGLEAVLPF